MVMEFLSKYKTSGSILIRNRFVGELSADQIIVDEKGVVEGTLKSSELIISGNVSGKINSDSIVIMEMVLYLVIFSINKLLYLKAVSLMLLA